MFHLKHWRAVVERDGAIVKQHCTETPDEIQAAIRAYKQRYDDAKHLVMGMEFMGRERLKEAKAELRRLSI